ncbi:DUF397 domain-containing protein [Streptomyces sp. NPDC059740]|uniref:DUF397 domain-containing protein n=1 Tax=Streptomyces sp. NPDC059740 TaxID=3346926 RepID=UPI0036542F09
MTDTSTGTVAEASWRKSTYSSNEGPDCVEVAPSPLTVLVRDSKKADGPRLSFTATAWADFLTHAAGD